MIAPKVHRVTCSSHDSPGITKRSDDGSRMRSASSNWMAWLSARKARFTRCLSLGRAYETTSTPADNRQKTGRTPSVKLEEKTPGNKKLPLDWKHTPHNSESVLVEKYSVHRNTNVGKQSIQTCTQSDIELNIRSNSSYNNSANVKHVKSSYSR